MLPWKPEFWANLPQNRMQLFPHPSDATHNFWSRLALEIFKFESVDDGRRTDVGPLVYYKLTLWAFD